MHSQSLKNEFAHINKCSQSRTIIRLSDLLFTKYPHIANSITSILDKHHIKFEVVNNTNDIWMRDYMPICLDDGTMVSYVYNPDYLNNEHDRCTITDVPKENKHLSLIIDGGNFVRYQDSVIMTDKIFSENKNIPKVDILSAIRSTCNIKNVVIIPKQPYDEYGHGDSMVRWIDKNSVVVNDFTIESISFYNKLIASLKAHNLEIKTMRYSDGFFTENRNWGAYLNFLKINSLSIVPIYGIENDTMALDQLKMFYPDCCFEPIVLNDIIDVGGALHCITSEKRELY